MPLAAIKAKNWGNANNEDINDLMESFYAALVNCSASVEEDFGTCSTRAGQQ